MDSTCEVGTIAHNSMLRTQQCDDTVPKEHRLLFLPQEGQFVFSRGVHSARELLFLLDAPRN